MVHGRVLLSLTLLFHVFQQHSMAVLPPSSCFSGYRAAFVDVLLLYLQFVFLVLYAYFPLFVTTLYNVTTVLYSINNVLYTNCAIISYSWREFGFSVFLFTGISLLFFLITDGYVCASPVSESNRLSLLNIPVVSSTAPWTLFTHFHTSDRS